MNSEELIRQWKEEERRPFAGWDFSYLDGKMRVESPPWSFQSKAVELMRSCSSMLDMGTGGGELLLEMKADWPDRVTVTEEYPPNFKLATDRLKPLGVNVVNVTLSTNHTMPFGNGEFELVLNHHSGLNPSEVGRILAHGGVFITQQVHGLAGYDLVSFFDSKPPYPNATPEFYVPQLEAAGLTIRDLLEWSGEMTFSDVGALVYYLKAIPWAVPGFSVETHSEYLLRLQRKLERGEGLAFAVRRYLIEAHKKL